YGVHVNEKEQNRQVTWSTRRDKGQVNLYYRLMLTPRYTKAPRTPEDGRQFRFSPQLQGVEATAAGALLQPIRKRSADIETFISETIKRVNDPKDDNAQLLLDGNSSPENNARVVALLLGVANIPTQLVYTLQLADSRTQQPELWLRTYNGQEWLYFNPVTGKESLPDDRIVWWTGQQPLLSLEGGSKPVVTFSVQRSEVGALQLAQSLSAKGEASFIDLSFHAIPVTAQQLLKIILMIPVGVLIVLLIRSFIGVETLGTFTPVLIALAFRE